MIRTIFTVLLLSFPSWLHSQGFFDLGCQVGINSSKISTRIHDYNATSVNGYQVGAFVRLGSNKKLSIHSEIMLQAKGGDYSYTISNSDPLTPQYQLSAAELKVRMTTVEVPVLLGIRLLHAGNSNLRFNFGPSWTYKIDEQISLSVDGVDQSLSLPEVMYADRSQGFQYGFGLDLNHITLNLRHAFSIENISVIEGMKQRNGVFLASLGYKIL